MAKFIKWWSLERLIALGLLIGLIALHVDRYFNK